jgi:hypothetical protein
VIRLSDDALPDDDFVGVSLQEVSDLLPLDLGME